MQLSKMTAVKRMVHPRILRPGRITAHAPNISGSASNLCAAYNRLWTRSAKFCRCRARASVLDQGTGGCFRCRKFAHRNTTLRTEPLRFGCIYVDTGYKNQYEFLGAGELGGKLNARIAYPSCMPDCPDGCGIKANVEGRGMAKLEDTATTSPHAACDDPPRGENSRYR